jgi:hypothetical protein
LLSYHVALIKGTDVDKPRNLAKSVTVELFGLVASQSTNLTRLMSFSPLR